MQLDFHYYATYCAALLAGYSHEESLAIATADEYTDCCTRTALKRMRAPLSAATTQTQMEMMDLRADILTLQDITRIWASFHFLPADLNAVPKGRYTRRYLNKYRLICGPNGALMTETVRLAKRENTLQAVGIAMHILADTWAHRYFAGTPSAVINNTDSHFFEIVTEEGKEIRRPVVFRHSVTEPDNPEKGRYTASLTQYNETSVMSLGHGRAGHLPDYSYIRYCYLPAWGDYEEVLKDNPKEYMLAFTQMIYAMRYIRGEEPEFRPDTYAWDAVEPVRGTVERILAKRQRNGSLEWKALGESLSGHTVPDFDARAFEQPYIDATPEEKDTTPPGQFILAALGQKSTVTKAIFETGNLMAGFSVTYSGGKGSGIKDFRKLIENELRKRQGTVAGTAEGTSPEKNGGYGGGEGE